MLSWLNAAPFWLLNGQYSHRPYSERVSLCALLEHCLRLFTHIRMELISPCLQGVTDAPVGDRLNFCQWDQILICSPSVAKFVSGGNDRQKTIKGFYLTGFCCDLSLGI